ncbi:MAG: hypothetical protein HPY76_05300, partial [Anaerolineae bacterium]|nr:hypothetical protein [Anaerolineae bacterium]
MKRLYILTSVILLASLLLAACGPQATSVPEEPTAVPEQPTAVQEQPTEPPAMAAIDCKGAVAGDTVTVMYQWSGAEEEKINSILKPLVDECGIQVVAEATRDAAVLDTKAKSTPPDVLFWPSTAPLTLYTEQLQDLSGLGATAGNYADYWQTLGTVDGK